MEKIWQDLRYGIRMLFKKPGFTAVAIITLVLGIGANSAIFTVINSVLLRPLPFKESDRLVFVHETARRETVERRPASYPDYRDWRDQNQVFEHIAAFDTMSLTMTGGEPEQIPCENTSSNYFQVLRVEAAQGRTYLPEEDLVPNPLPVVVISDGLWKRRFGSDPGVVGKTIRLIERDHTILGVMPEGFKGITGTADLWVPFLLNYSGPSSPSEDRGSRWHQTIARLKPGVTLEQAQADMSAIAAALEQQYPRTNANRGVLIVPAHEDLLGNLRPMLLILLGAVAFILLIACANVANLLLVRASSRQKEIAIRTALGASRSRVVSQLITESLLLSVAGGALGLLLAVWGSDLLIALSPVQLPSYVSTDVDLNVLAFTLLVSVATGVVFGLAPALQASTPALNETLKDAAKGASVGSRPQRVRRVLVVAEIAMALVLLICAGLMIKSFQRLQQFDPGYRVDNVLGSRVSLPSQKYSVAQASVFARQLVERLEAIPTVKAVALGTDSPLDGYTSATTLTFEGSTNPDGDLRIYRHSVTPRFFETLGISLLQGRDFGPQDTEQAPRVAIVAEAMARRAWPDQDPIGKRFKVGRLTGEAPWYTVVGVVGDVKYRRLVRDQNSDPDIYLSVQQHPTRHFALVARAEADAASLAPLIRQEVQTLDPNLPLFEVSTMQQRMADQTSGARFTAVLLAVFAALAVLLAGVGIYGVMNFAVAQRTHEIGIRMALGARQFDVIKMILREGMALTALGVTIGLTGAFLLTRVLAGQLYSVSATDPQTFAMVSLLLAGVALVANFIPARRATRVDPVIALRYE
jgi:predicted permease